MVFNELVLVLLAVVTSFPNCSKGQFTVLGLGFLKPSLQALVCNSPGPVPGEGWVNTNRTHMIFALMKFRVSQRRQTSKQLNKQYHNRIKIVKALRKKHVRVVEKNGAYTFIGWWQWLTGTTHPTL